MKVKINTILLPFVVFISSLSTGCLPYIYHQRSEALIDGIDVDQSLQIAELELEDGGFGSVLTVWALRDQHITPEQASRISELYFRYIPKVSEDRGRFFNMWHLTWAISNFYRLGDNDVRLQLGAAYRDAALRVDDLDSRVATTHFNDEKLHMGLAHFGGVAYAKKHLVVPGNPDFLQSLNDYESNKNLRHNE